MKKIINPWHGMKEYCCYGCAPHNESGLRMEFYEDGEEIVSVWHPEAHHQGWINTLHGGVQATLADEISSWVVFRRCQTAGVTSKMEIRYHKSILTTEPYVVLRASIKEQKRNLVDIEVGIYNANNERCTTAVCTYYLFSKEKAHDLFYFRECTTEEADVDPLPESRAVD